MSFLKSNLDIIYFMLFTISFIVAIIFSEQFGYYLLYVIYNLIYCTFF